MSRVTPDERRDVAKGLRYIANCCPPVQSLEQFRGALEDELFTGPGHANYTDIFTRLADLIDPTCHVTDEEVTHEPTLNALAVHVYECDKCGWYFYMAEVCCHPKPFYCPACGARVVRDES